MILVVDAYNVLKQVSPTTDITQKIRSRFIQDNTHYSKAKHHTVVLVFDAGPTQWPHKQQIQGVQVVYSGTRMSADDYIKEYIQSHKGHELLLVSSDRALCSWALNYKVESLESRAFYALLQEVINKKTMAAVNYTHEVLKTTEHNNAELDNIMYATNVEGNKEDEVHKQERKSAAHRPSKKEREIGKKIKKL